MKPLRSKTSVPGPAPHHVDRPRLLHRLSDHADLILLAAPAGYGKTVLASQLVARVPPGRCAWIHLDPYDADPGRFGTYFLEALAAGPIPALRKSGLQERLSGKHATLEQIADDLLFFLEEQRGSSAWIVLDNWELVDSHEEISRFLERIAFSGQGRLKLVVNSRVLPSFRIRKRQEQGRLVLLDKHELAFSFPEFVEAFRQRTTEVVPDEQLEAIWRHTEGWCVNLGLVVETLRHREPIGGAPHAGRIHDSDSLIGYVEEEILPAISPDLLDFLTRCAILDPLSPQSCADIIGDSAKARSMLKSLAASSIPHFPLSGELSYRLHPIVKQAAQSLLRKRLTKEELHDLYHRGVEVYLQRGSVLEAIGLLLDLPDYDLALETIRSRWYEILSMSEQDRIREWLEAFPQEVREKPRYVELMSNLLSISGNNHQLITYLADRLDLKAFPGQGEILATCWMHHRWAWLHENSEPGYEVTTKSWESLLAERGPFNAMIQAGAQNVLSYAAMAELRFERALDHMESCLALQEDHSFDYQISTRSNLALLHHHLGSAGKALEEYQACVRDCEEQGQFTCIPHALGNMADVLISMGRYTEALGAAERCRSVMRENALRNAGVEAGLDRARGLALWFLGSWDEGLGLLERAFDRYSAFSAVERVGVGLTIEYYSTLSGCPKSVISAGEFSPDDHVSENQLIGSVVRSWRAIEEKRIGEAETSAGRVLRTASDRKLAPWKVTARFLLARCAWLEGRRAEERRHLTEGLGALASTDWAGYPMANPRLTASVCVQAMRLGLRSSALDRLLSVERPPDLTRSLREGLENASTPREVKRLLQAAAERHVRGLSPVAKEHSHSGDRAVREAADRYLKRHAAGNLPPLRIRMLGGFEVGSAAGSARFSRKKSRLILQMLLIEHPTPVHEEVLMDTLWPDADPDRARASLQTAVRDLRRDLDTHHEPRGKSYIEYADGNYSLFLPEESTCDAHHLRESLERELPRRRREDDGQVDERRLRRMIEPFSGPFLPEQKYEAFAMEYRERLHRLFLDAVLFLARSFNRGGRHAEAIEVLERGLEIDPLWGEGVQELMIARSGNGELCRALRIYREYELRIRKELDLPPDEEMKRCFERLLSAGAGEEAATRVPTQGIVPG